MATPLSGIKVLDLSRALAGPFCTQMLGDMGADVIKVESPGGGDETRHWGPFWEGTGCYFLGANRNKKSIVIDLKTDEGKNLVLAMADRSDVFFENFRPGVVNRLGLDYETLAARNPRLVYSSVSGFGQDGPRAKQPAFDLLMQGFGGLMSVTGEDGGPPIRTGVSLTDLAAAMYSAYGIMIALLYREKSGRGQKVETSLLEGSVSWLLHNLIEYLATGIIPKRKQSSSPVIAPYQAIKAMDDYVIVAVGNEGQWKRFCGAIGAPELVEDPRFVTNKERTTNRETLDEVLNGIFRKHTAAELIEWMSNAQVPCGPVSTIDRVVNDPQVQHLGLIQNVSHPDLPDLRLCGIPFKLSETPGAIQCPPPRLGEHTDQILNEHGFSGGRITELRNKGVVE